MNRGTASSQRPATLRERQKLFTRQQLVDAAREEFATRGYVNTTVEHIAARAGASRATFYMHFASKVQVLAVIGEALRPEIDDCYRRLDIALANGSPDDLREWMAAMLVWSDRHGPLVPAWEQAMALEPEFADRVTQIVTELPDVMTAYLERQPAEEREQARLRIVLLEAQLSRFLFRMPVRNRSAEERAMIADVLTDIWHGALQARSGAPPTVHPAAPSQAEHLV